jgi:WD40 repeat protein
MSVAIRRQDNRVAIGTYDGTLRLPERDDFIRAHNGPIVHVEFDGKGERIVTASTDETATLWNARTGARLMQLSGHKDTVQTAQFSPDGRAVVTASRDGSAILWDVSAKLPRQRFQLIHTAAVVSARFDPAGTHIITACEDGSVRIWSAVTGESLGPPLKHDEPLVSADFSPEGLRIVTATATRVVVWSIDGYRMLEPIQFDATVTGVSFSADGRRLVTTTADGVATLWDVRQSAAAPVSMRVPCGPNAVVKFTGTNNQVAVGCPDSGRIDFWDVSTGRLGSSESNPAWVGLRSFDFRTGSGRVLAVSEGTAIIARIGAPEVVTLAHGSRIFQATFSPDGKLVGTAGDDGAAVWDSTTGQTITRVARGSQAWTIDFTADSARIVTSSDNGSTEVWDARTGNKIGPPIAATDANNQSDARIDGSGRRVVVTSRRGLSLYDSNTGARIAGLPVVASLDRARTVFAPDGSTFVTVGDRVQLWDAEQGQLLATLRERSLPIDAQFSTDGKRLMTTHENGLRFWNAANGQPQSGLIGVGAGDFGPATMDGQRVVAVTRDGFVRAWDFPLGTLQDADSIATVLELIVGYKCNERGAGEPVDKWIDKLQAARADAGLTSVAAWALADRDTRAIGPFTTVTKDEYIREQLASGSLDALREAQRLFPWDPQVSNKGVAR